jgi:glutamate-1-semialdehyde 2,1-aminomutase
MATIQWLHAHRGIYRELDSAGKRISDEIAGKGGSFVQRGSMFKFFFRATPPRNYREVKECDTARFSSFWSAMLKAGIFLPPSQFETNFLSAAHDDQDVDRISAAYRSCL